jgi:hypothetical protein
MAKLNAYQNILLGKIKDRPDYVGYYLQKYCELEKIDQNELMKILSLSEEDFIKLALCRLSPPLSTDFAESIDKISKYVDVNEFALSQLIKKVAITEKQNATKIIGLNPNRNLMAARENEKKDPTEGQGEKRE